MAEHQWKPYRLVIAFVAINLVLVTYFVFWRHAEKEPVQTFTKTPVQSEFDAPLENSLPDVSQWSTPFEAVASFTPLHEQAAVVAKLVYQTDVVTFNRFVFKDGTVADLPESADLPKRAGLRTQTQQFVKEIEFEPPADADTIPHVERIHAEGKMQAPEEMKNLGARRVLHVDGRYLNHDPADGLGFTFQEVEPLWYSEAVREGSSWTQKIEVDPALNPGGYVEAQISVGATYVRDGQQYVRIHRTFGFKAYRPNAASRGSQIVDDGKKHTLTFRIDELFDLEVATGIVRDRSTVTEFLTDAIGMSEIDERINGLLVTMRARETLRDIVMR